MRLKLSIFLTLFLSLPGMEAPLSETETIPIKMQDLHHKEQRKFKKYDLDHPEKFLHLMREQFNYKGNKEEYLKQLQILLSGLLIQHQTMFYLGEHAFFLTQYYQLKYTYNMLIKKLNAKILTAGVDINPETPEQLNIILAHNDLLNKTETFSPEDLSIIFSWILDTEKGAWLNNLGLLEKNVLEVKKTAEQSNLAANKARDIAIIANEAPFQTINPFIIDNFVFVNEYISQNANLKRIELASTGAATEKASRNYKQLMVDLAQLYRIHQKEYLSLYNIVRQELSTVYREAISAGQKIPPTILLPIPEYFRKQGYIPAKFPDQLETIKNPATYLTHATLDAELEKARVEWNKIHAQKPKIKKKIRRRRQFTLETESVEPGAKKEIEAIEPIEEVKKIKIGPDGSYIAQDTEDDLKIIIENPINDSTAIIFKTKNSPENIAQLKKLPKINYTNSVLAWFDNPKQALINQGYTDPKNPRYRAGEPAWKAIVLHAFPQLIDDYIWKYGTVSETPSRRVKDKKDIMVTIPGQMEYPDGTEETGIFTYLIDPTNGQWFHRMFTPSSHKKMAADFLQKGYFAPEIQGYYDVYFPPLPK